MNRTHLGFKDALLSLPRPGGHGYHPQLLGVANRGIWAGIHPVELIAMIRQHTPAGDRRVSDKEISDAVNKALREHTGNPRRWTGLYPRPATRPFNTGAFMAARMAEANGIGEYDISEASPVRIDWSIGQDATELLTRLYAPADMLFIGDRFDKQVKSVAAWLAEFRDGCLIPPHIIPNPLTGQAAQTKDGKPSYRADACVKSYRFAVAEFDNLSREDQLRFWWSINLPVCALIDSGGKSLHAWIKVDGVTTADEWTTQVEDQLFGQYLVPLGCDTACRNEARLSRMPGHFRAEKQHWQRIIYLAPEGRRINT